MSQSLRANGQSAGEDLPPCVPPLFAFLRQNMPEGCRVHYARSARFTGPAHRPPDVDQESDHLTIVFYRDGGQHFFHVTPSMEVQLPELAQKLRELPPPRLRIETTGLEARKQRLIDEAHQYGSRTRDKETSAGSRTPRLRVPDTNLETAHAFLLSRATKVEKRQDNDDAPETTFEVTAGVSELISEYGDARGRKLLQELTEAGLVEERGNTLIIRPSKGHFSTDQLPSPPRRIRIEPAPGLMAALGAPLPITPPSEGPTLPTDPVPVPKEDQGDHAMPTGVIPADRRLRLNFRGRKPLTGRNAQAYLELLKQDPSGKKDRIPLTDGLEVVTKTCGYPNPWYNLRNAKFVVWDDASECDVVLSFPFTIPEQGDGVKAVPLKGKIPSRTNTKPTKKRRGTGKGSDTPAPEAVRATSEPPARIALPTPSDDVECLVDKLEAFIETIEPLGFEVILNGRGLIEPRDADSVLDRFTEALARHHFHAVRKGRSEPITLIHRKPENSPTRPS